MYFFLVLTLRKRDATTTTKGAVEAVAVEAVASEVQSDVEREDLGALLVRA
jgi:hypothetical protein